MRHVSSLRAAVGDLVQRWAVESQQGARRNAMRASTDLAALRKERLDVESFLVERGAGKSDAEVDLHDAVPAVPHGL